jgi:hypothetical protein
VNLYYGGGVVILPIQINSQIVLRLIPLVNQMELGF